MMSLTSTRIQVSATFQSSLMEVVEMFVEDPGNSTPRMLNFLSGTDRQAGRQAEYSHGRTHRSSLVEQSLLVFTIFSVWTLLIVAPSCCSPLAPQDTEAALVVVCVCVSVCVMMN